MKANKLLILLATSAMLASCGGASSSSSASVDPDYNVSWVTPTGIPTLAFYSQASNQNWTTYSDATEVAKGFATDNVDAIVFDGYAGLKNIMTNNRNYVMASWISGGTFYLVSTKHSALSEYQAGQTVDAFVKTGNAAQAFLSLAKNQWNWGDLSGEDAAVTWETGVAAVKNHLAANDEAFDWYLVAQPVLFALTNQLKQAGKTLNVVANLQTEWANAHNGAKIPAAALFVNKTRYAQHKGNIDEFIEHTKADIITAIGSPSGVVTALNNYAEAGGDVVARFGFQPAVVSALQKDGANGFGLINPNDVKDIASIANAFAKDLGTSITFADSLFLK